MSPDPACAVGVAEARAQLAAAGGTSRYAGEPAFTHLPALMGALRTVSRAGGPDDVRAALVPAAAMGAAWERMGRLRQGLEHLDALVDAVGRTGLPHDLEVAQVLRRRGRLAMRARLDARADADFAAAYALAAGTDDALALSVMLDRVDLAAARGDWASAGQAVPELLRRTGGSGDPLRQAMGLNRAGWIALGQGDLATARDRYEQAWALAELHEDGTVESRTAAGLALVACHEGDLEVARSAWRQSLGLAERLHDRAFTLHCLDGIALLLALQGQGEAALRLLEATEATRALLAQPREVPVELLAAQVRGAAPETRLSDPPMAYDEALAAAREAVARA